MLSEEKRRGDVAEIIAGCTGFAEKGTYTYRVVQPNSFDETGVMGSVDIQCRSDEIASKLLLASGDVLVKRLNPSFVHVVNDESIGMAVSQNLLVVRPCAGIDPYYLFPDDNPVPCSRCVFTYDAQGALLDITWYAHSRNYPHE